MSYRRAVHWLMWLTPLAACGGRVEAGDGGPPTTVVDSGMGTSPPPRDFPACPPAKPQPAEACFAPGQGCRYYDPPACSAFVCGAGGSWQAVRNGC
ncbi:MAG: hypothetical protein M3O36_03585 [Myxococcota bacterium]|nr:hypothetical protein [Myxococcota bacterium]